MFWFTRTPENEDVSIIKPEKSPYATSKADKENPGFRFILYPLVLCSLYFHQIKQEALFVLKIKEGERNSESHVFKIPLSSTPWKETSEGLGF